VTLESCPYGSRTFDNSIIARKKSLLLENSRTPNFLSVPKHSGRIDFLLGIDSRARSFLYLSAPFAPVCWWIELWPAPQPLRLHTINTHSISPHSPIGRPFKRKVYARGGEPITAAAALSLAAAGAYPRTRNHFKRQLMPARHYHKIEQHFSRRAHTRAKKRATKWRRVALLKKVKRASGVYQI
jgi:hypothetical protein